MSWATSDRFAPKLRRLCEAAENQARQDPDMWSFLTEGCELSQTVLTEMVSTTGKIEQISERLDAVELLTKRIRSIADEDQPSQ
jgi:hypothetical protein